MTTAHACGIALLEVSRGRRVLLVAAHPDDEVVGFGATLVALALSGAHVTVLHATDGAPRDLSLRPTLRHCSRGEAARLRRLESERALRAGGLDPGKILAASLGIADQEAACAMPLLARSVAARLPAIDVVVTHPYEGGHPDHDAAAFAVHAARRIFAREGGSPIPALAEMTSYHAERGSLATGCFLASPAPACSARHDGLLGARARRTKRRMLDAFATQRDVLASLGIGAGVEPLRCAPSYDFTEPPHEGALYYEQLPFGWTGAYFRELARDALRELRLA
jgi:LmbE family N-acetylglucosaminyl deacetylase